MTLSSLNKVEQQLAADRARALARDRPASGQEVDSLNESIVDSGDYVLNQPPVSAGMMAPPMQELPSQQTNGCDTANAPSVGGGICDFESNPENFTRILSFLRDKKNFVPPEDLQERAILCQEAKYFGCMELVSQLER
eukprot:gnl/MRDRNA2_/MRDRNA2_63917_c0_seq2.p1 gnl/MRDRNA2_/MRDRNA2_63917_c0~~gnl/MRDRNA2_/MRDRNA2_63917_c0_seq2.p1  ORF type:complete len:138 (+),score=33.33 gnl/MRDRNA2_/MRDRNA2_63917_c0_seq2:72-485(+)